MATQTEVNEVVQEAVQEVVHPENVHKTSQSRPRNTNRDRNAQTLPLSNEISKEVHNAFKYSLHWQSNGEYNWAHDWQVYAHALQHWYSNPSYRVGNVPPRAPTNPGSSQMCKTS